MVEAPSGRILISENAATGLRLNRSFHPPPLAMASRHTSRAIGAVTGLQDFYDGLYHSSLYAQHHRVCCNVGLASTAASSVASAASTPASPPKPQRNAEEQYQLNLYRELLGLVPASEDSKIATFAPGCILDIGCGAGGGLCELQSLCPNAQLLGLDFSSQALTRSKQTWTRWMTQQATPEQTKRSPPRFLHQSCENMKGLPSHSVDVVCAVQCLQEVQNLPLAVREIERVLKPGGFLLVADFIPKDAAEDYIQEQLLTPIIAGVPMTNTNKIPGFDMLQERVVTQQVLQACKASSPTTETLIRQLIPADFQKELEDFFHVQNSTSFEDLQSGASGFRLLCLKKTSTDALDAAHAHDDDDVDNDSGEWSDEARDDGSDWSSDYEEIQDDDLPNYYDYASVYPQLEVLKANAAVILKEMQAVQDAASWPNWPEKHYASEESDWRVFPFCYTFPAWDASKTTWVDQTCEFCPRTVEILRNLPGIRTALFSKLGPKTTLNAHRGWADLSNDILRCHLALVVPKLDNGDSCCAMVVGGETKYHEENELLVFDDSKLHLAYNQHTEKTRTILIVDLYRPDHLPRGRARGGHTDELDEFINNFGQDALGGLNLDDLK